MDSDRIPKISVNGFAFEIGFKLGLVHGFIQRWPEQTEWQNVRNDLLDRVRKRDKKDGNLGVVGKILRSLTFDELTRTSIWNHGEKNFYRVVEEKGLLDSSPREPTIVQINLYLDGLYGGMLTAMDRNLFPDGASIKPEVFSIFNENKGEAGCHKNADALLLVEEGSRAKLICWDFKLRGGTFHYATWLMPSSDAVYVPPSMWGVNFSLSLGKSSFKNFLDHLLQKGNLMVNSKELPVSFEFRSIVQVFAYMMDYLSENQYWLKDVLKVSVDRVHAGLIYSTVDGVNFSFDLNEDVDVSDYAKKLKNLYSDINQKLVDQGFISLTEASKTTNPDAFEVMLDLYEKSLREEIKSYLNEMALRNERSNSKWAKEIVLDGERSIKAVRDSVEKEMRAFWKGNPWGKIFISLSSTGTGKTTSVVKVIIHNFLKNGEGKLVVWYFAPRKQLLNDFKDKIMDSGENEIKKKAEEYVEIIMPSVKGESRESPFYWYREVAVEFFQGREGKIKETANALMDRIARLDKKIFVCLNTLQSATQVQGSLQSTLKHIKRCIGSYRDMGATGMVFIFDEIIGNNNGFFTLRETLEMFDEYKHMMSILVFDATLHSKGVFETIWNEYMTRNYLAPSFFVTRFEQDGEMDIFGWKAVIRSGYTYPARILRIREVFPIDLIAPDSDLDDDLSDEKPEYFGTEKESARKKQEEMWCRCVADVVEREYRRLNQDSKDSRESKEKERVYTYIQHRERAYKTKENLQSRKYSIGVCTSNDREASSDYGRFDIVISTSTLSRGVSFKQNFTKAVIVCPHFWGFEENVIEDIQAGARIRGMKDDEKRIKEIVRVYAVTPYENEGAMEMRARSWLECFVEDEILDEGILDEEADKEKARKELVRKIKKVLKLATRRNLLRGLIQTANLMLNLYEAYYTPHQHDEVCVVVPQQLDPEYVPNFLEPACSFVSFLREMSCFDQEFNEEERKKIAKLENEIREFLIARVDVILSEVKKELEAGRAVVFHPYLYVSLSLSTAPVKERIRRIKQAFREACNVFLKNEKKRNKYGERIIEISRWMEEVSVGENRIRMHMLIYIPLLSMIYDGVPPDFVSRPLRMSPYITRFGIPVIGGALWDRIHLKADEHDKKSKHSVVFPIGSSKEIAWLTGEYIKLDCDFLNVLLKSYRSKKE